METERFARKCQCEAASRVTLLFNVQVDMNELQEFLNEAGALDIFGANSAQEVMSIFDTDGNGTLEPEEMECLMQFIEAEKARLLELGGSRDSSTRENAIASADAMKRKKLETISKLEQSAHSADQDGDGIVDLEEVSVRIACH